MLGPSSCHKGGDRFTLNGGPEMKNGPQTSEKSHEILHKLLKLIEHHKTKQGRVSIVPEDKDQVHVIFDTGMIYADILVNQHHLQELSMDGICEEGRVMIQFSSGEERILKVKGTTRQECERAAYMIAYGNEEGEADNPALVGQYSKFMEWA